MTTPALPKLRPTALHKAYYDELRAIDTAVGAALEAEARAMKGKGLTINQLCGLALRYRLKFAALMSILEDRGVLSTGAYDRMQRSIIAAYADGKRGPFAPMRLLAEHVAANGLPDPAPGCEEVQP